MTLREGSMGRASFIERHGLWRDAEREAAARVLKSIGERKLEVVRLSFADQHGLLRGKTIVADDVGLALQNGCTITTTLLAKDTAHRTVYPVFTQGGGFGMAEMTGAADFVMVPDPSTFRILPWSPHTGWMLCDIYFPSGKPVPFSTRQLFRDVLADLAGRGHDYVAGLEIEFHVFKLLDAKLKPEQAGQPAHPPEVDLLAHGFQYLTETRMDELEPAVDLLRRHIVELGLPLRTVEVEFGPSQCEFTFAPGIGLDSADLMVLFRSAAKQICRRHGLHASFMCRPAIPNLFSSGWHLHQSLRDRRTGANAFVPCGETEALSALGLHFAAGILAHARGGSIFAAPTVNGYKRFRPYSLAPDRANWGRDNRGAMLRVIGAPGDPGSRIENRIGEPAANPYLYMASQIVAGLDGVAHELDPGPPVDMPYETKAPPLPRSLMEAVAALREDTLFRERFGAGFIDYLVTIKEAEIARFLSEVTDWEQREYFEIF